MTMRSNQFLIPGDPKLDPTINVALLEQADGSILVTLTQSGGKTTDIRGLFFDVTDASILSNLVVTGSQVTGSLFKDEGVTNLGNGVTMEGAQVSAFDAGVSFGTAGIGQNNVLSTSFVLSSNNGTPLTLDLLSNVDFGVRLNSVGGKILRFRRRLRMRSMI